MVPAPRSEEAASTPLLCPVTLSPRLDCPVPGLPHRPRWTLESNGPQSSLTLNAAEIWTLSRPSREEQGGSTMTDQVWPRSPGVMADRR
jgi:hypothetical protein